MLLAWKMSLISSALWDAPSKKCRIIVHVRPAGFFRFSIDNPQKPNPIGRREWLMIIERQAGAFEKYFRGATYKSRRRSQQSVSYSNFWPCHRFVRFPICHALRWGPLFVNASVLVGLLKCNLLFLYLDVNQTGPCCLRFFQVRSI